MREKEEMPLVSIICSACYTLRAASVCVSLQSESILRNSGREEWMSIILFLLLISWLWAQELAREERERQRRHEWWEEVRVPAGRHWWD